MAEPAGGYARAVLARSFAQGIGKLKRVGGALPLIFPLVASHTPCASFAHIDGPHAAKGRLGQRHPAGSFYFAV